MTRVLQFVLTGLCAGLSLIVMIEIFPLTGENNSFAAVPTTRTSTLIERAGPGPDMEAIVTAILERPLFTPGRHPSQIASFGPIVETSEDAPRQLSGRLAGVTIRPGVREALFMREGQKPITVNVGGEIEGWRISAIEPDRVTLSSASGSQTIKPTNDPDAVHPPARPIPMGVGMAPSTVSSASRAGGNLARRVAGAALPATPNPVVGALPIVGRAGGRGPR